MTVDEHKQREIDRLRTLIDQECQTLNAGLQGLTGAPRHTLVSERMNIIGTYADELATLVGTAEALTFVLELIATMKQAQSSDAPPTFLQVGNTMIAIAYMTGVQVVNHAVHITVLDEGMDITFEGDEAERFLELFQAHCRIISE